MKPHRHLIIGIINMLIFKWEQHQHHRHHQPKNYEERKLADIVWNREKVNKD